MAKKKFSVIVLFKNGSWCKFKNVTTLEKLLWWLARKNAATANIYDADNRKFIKKIIFT